MSSPEKGLDQHDEGRRPLIPSLEPIDRLFVEIFHSGTAANILGSWLFDGVPYPGEFSAIRLGRGLAAKLALEVPVGLDQRVGCEIRLESITGTVSREAAQRLLDRVRPALRHCLVHSYWLSDKRPESSETRMFYSYRAGAPPESILANPKLGWTRIAAGFMRGNASRGKGGSNLACRSLASRQSRDSGESLHFVRSAEEGRCAWPAGSDGPCRPANSRSVVCEKSVGQRSR